MTNHQRVLVFVVYKQVYEKNLLTATFINKKTGKEYKANYFMVARYILKDSIALTAVGAFSFVMGFAIM